MCAGRPAASTGVRPAGAPHLRCAHSQSASFPPACFACLARPTALRSSSDHLSLRPKLGHFATTPQRPHPRPNRPHCAPARWACLRRQRQPARASWSPRRGHRPPAPTPSCLPPRQRLHLWPTMMALVPCHLASCRGPRRYAARSGRRHEVGHMRRLALPSREAPPRPRSLLQDVRVARGQRLTLRTPMPLAPSFRRPTRSRASLPRQHLPSWCTACAALRSTLLPRLS